MDFHVFDVLYTSNTWKSMPTSRGMAYIMMTSWHAFRSTSILSENPTITRTIGFIFVLTPKFRASDAE